MQRAYGDLFQVDADSGAIYLRTTLDYETSTAYYLTVTATDLGTPPSLLVSAKVMSAFIFSVSPLYRAIPYVCYYFYIPAICPAF